MKLFSLFSELISMPYEEQLNFITKVRKERSYIPPLPKVREVKKEKVTRRTEKGIVLTPEQLVAAKQLGLL